MTNNYLIQRVLSENEQPVTIYSHPNSEHSLRLTDLGYFRYKLEVFRGTRIIIQRDFRCTLKRAKLILDSMASEWIVI